MNDQDNDFRQSADDALEPQDDSYKPTSEQTKLPNDYGSPAAPADDTGTTAPIDSPAMDDGIDSDELYQEGMSGATNADDQEVDPDEEPKALDSFDQS